MTFRRAVYSSPVTTEFFLTRPWSRGFYQLFGLERNRYLLTHQEQPDGGIIIPRPKS